MIATYNIHTLEYAWMINRVYSQGMALRIRNRHFEWICMMATSGKPLSKYYSELIMKQRSDILRR